MRSRVMPPKFPATNERTRTPNRSSRRLTPAVPPLSAKTKVPRRSSTSRSVFMAVVRPIRDETVFYAPRIDRTRDGGLRRRQPGARGDDQRFHPGLKGGMQNRCKAWAVVDRKVVQAAFLLGFRVSVGIGPADEPEHGGGLPLGSETSEIFARRSRSGVHDAVGGKICAKASATRSLACLSLTLSG